MDTGIEEKWFENTTDFPGMMTVPAAWNAHGAEFPSADLLRGYEEKFLNGTKLLGTQWESERLFHVYPGPAWYRKTVTIPEAWTGKTPWLILKGVHRYADVWINGIPAGSHYSYLTPFRVDLSRFAKAGGEIAVTIRVDARRNRAIDPLMGCLDTLDFLYLSWGGLYRDVILEATSSIRLKNIFIRPVPESGTAEIYSELEAGDYGKLEIKGEILDAKNEIVAQFSQSAGEGMDRIRLVIKIENPVLWSPELPHLYRANLKLFNDGVLADAHSVRFGMRKFEVRGDQFLLNGKPIFLRGYGDDSIFPNTISPPPDVEAMRRRLAVAKAYGFNYVRHHSWTPPSEYLEAADELGMLLQVEFPFAYSWDLPKDPEVIGYALDQWKQMIRMNRNHPSVATWCMGNELYESFSFAPQMYRIARELDPDRPIIDTDGFYLQAYPDRDTVDFITAQFREGDSIGFNDSKYNIPGDVNKPVVAHETGYFTSLPDLTQKDLFQSGMRPYWLNQTEELAAKKNILDKYPEWLEASYKLQALSLKTNIEAARRSALSGFSVWLFQDYPNCAEGVVDMFFRKKALSAEEFMKFNAPSVLLMDAPRRNWWQGENAQISFLISRFEDLPTEAATLRWTLWHDGKVVGSGANEGLSIRSDGVQPLMTVDIPLPALRDAVELQLHVELTDENGTIDNSWNFWSFPKENQEYVSVGSDMELIRKLCPSVSEISKEILTADPELVVTDRICAVTLERLESGGSVLLLGPGDHFSTEKTNFRQSSWDGGGPTGTLIDKTHPSLHAMPTDGWCDLLFYNLIQGSDTVNLDELPVKIEPIVRCIDKPMRLANRAYLFEVKIGEGKLLVSSFNFKRALEMKDPGGIYFLDQLIRYARGNQFDPEVLLQATALNNIAAQQQAENQDRSWKDERRK